MQKGPESCCQDLPADSRAADGLQEDHGQYHGGERRGKHQEILQSTDRGGEGVQAAV